MPSKYWRLWLGCALCGALGCAVKPASAAPPAPAPRAVVRYEPHYARVSGGDPLITLRRIVFSDATVHYLVLNTATFETSLSRAPIVGPSCGKADELDDGTPYFSLIKDISSDYKRYTRGVDHCGGPGYVLSCDLCPSSRGLDREFIEYLCAEGISPVYLCVSGKWLLHHRDDLAWLAALCGIEIRWVNHSYNHYYRPGAPPCDNFLLHAGTNLRHEVLDNERLMVEHGLLPSPFFRYPGLVSDEALSRKILDYGLLPLGADAWLAKGDKVRPGSIVLLHVNGNEEPGLRLFRQWHSREECGYFPTFFMKRVERSGK